MAMFPIMISLIHPGQALQNNGGNPMQTRIGSWVVLCGRVLITAVNPHLMDGRASIRISALWICAGSPKIIITTTKAGGVIKMYCRSVRTGTLDGDSVDVWVNSNADEVELKLNGKSLGKKTMERSGHLEWRVKYKPGKLEAMDGRTGKKIYA